MKRTWSFRATRFFVETFQFRNFRHPWLLLPKGNYIYNIYIIYSMCPFWKRRNSLQNYIHRIQVPSENIHHFFWGSPPNSIGFHCKIVFFHSSPTPVVGGTLRWAWKTHFFEYNTKRNWSFRGTCFLVETF